MRRLLMSVVLAAFVLFAMLLASTAQGSALRSTLRAVDGKQYKVVLAQVVHRHGARTATGLEEPASTLAKICGSIGCGQLTRNGEDMLKQLGLWARHRYMVLPPDEDKKRQNTSPTSSGETTVDTVFISNSTYYSHHQIYQRSTDVTRTLQSAAAFVQGLFDDAHSSRFPVIQTISLEDDSMLYVRSIPSYAIYKEVKKKKIGEQYDVHVFNALNRSAWVAVGAEFDLGEKCDMSSGTLRKCSHEVYNVAESYNAEGTLSQSKYPLAYKYWHSGLLGTVKGWWHYDLLHTNWSKHTDEERGPLGLNVVGELVHQISKKVKHVKKAEDTKPLHLLREYSTEDTTLTVLSGFFGHSWSMRTPAFGEAFWFELLQSGQGSTDSDFRVRVVHGAPGQTPASGHTFDNMRNFNLTCADATTGKVYSVGTESDLGCPLADFLAYYNYYNGFSPKGLNCYVHKKHLESKHMDCYSTGSGAPKKSLCSWYRKQCPQYACPSGSYLQFPNLNCQPFPTQGSV